MVEITDVGITAGAPSSGDGTVPTLAKTNPLLGAVNETAPGTDTASSGLNGRLQRIAQNITTQFTALLGRLPAALGAGGGIKVDGSGTALAVSLAALPALATGGNTIGAVGIVGSVAVASLPSLPAGAANIGDVDVLSLPSIPAGNNNIGDVDIATMPSLPTGGNAIGTVGVTAVPADPYGVNADAASVSGSISAKLRAMATVWGAQADAKNSATDVTAISAMAVLKQISASIQAAVVAWGSTALDFGSGVLSARTLRVVQATDDPVTVATGAIADAASATGSISAKLRGLATAWGITAIDFGAGVLSARTLRVVLANDQRFFANAYETVAASQTAQVMGTTGAIGDWLAGILVIPATTSPGVITLLDNAISIPLFVGGATSISNLLPFFIPLNLTSVSGAWKITTGANVSCIGIGKFT